MKPRSERRRPDRHPVRRWSAVPVALLTLSALLAPAVAAPPASADELVRSRQTEPTDPGATGSTLAPDEPTETTRPEDETTTTTEPDDAPTTTEAGAEGAPDDGPDEPTATEEPTAADAGTDETDDDAADAITWVAIGLALLLLGVGVGWMLRRPPQQLGPPTDDDWPGSEVL